MTCVLIMTPNESFSGWKKKSRGYWLAIATLHETGSGDREECGLETRNNRAFEPEETSDRRVCPRHELPMHSLVNGTQLDLMVS